jgi:hypothetical protein
MTGRGTVTVLGKSSSAVTTEERVAFIPSLIYFSSEHPATILRQLLCDEQLITVLGCHGNECSLRAVTAEHLFSAPSAFSAVPLFLNSHSPLFSHSRIRRSAPNISQSNKVSRNRPSGALCKTVAVLSGSARLMD